MKKGLRTDLLRTAQGALQPLARGSERGMAVNLLNNLWSSNYPMNYPYYDPALCSSRDPKTCADANMRFRFHLSFEPAATAQKSDDSAPLEVVTTNAP